MWCESDEPANFTAWKPGQPDNFHNTEDCVEIMTDLAAFGFWNDISCSVKQNSICQN